MASSSQVLELIQKMSDLDKDYRYMALKDLMTELGNDSIKMDERLQRKIVTAVVNLMSDNNGEVQNMAVKCLGMLVTHLEPTLLQELVRTLMGQISKGDDQIRDIHGLGLKTLIAQLPSTSPAAAGVYDYLVVALLENTASADDGRVLECLDLLAEIIRLYGREAHAQHAAIVAALLPLLEHTRSFVQKKSINGLALLAPVTNNELFGQLVQALLERASNTSPASKQAQTLMWAFAALSREVGLRLGPYIPQVVPFVLTHITVEEEDELRETCLQVLEALAHNAPADFAIHMDDTVKLAVEYLQFDPNYSYDDDDDDMDDDDDDAFGDDDDEDDYSDDDDTTWKVRRAAAKTLSACIVTRVDLLEQFLTGVLPAVVTCFREREENVRVDVFATFETLVKQVHLTAGDTSVDSESMVADTASQSLLREALPSVFRHIAKQTKDKNMKVRTALVRMLQCLARSLREAFAEYLPAVLDLLEHTMTDTTSSTNVKTEALVLLHALLKSHSAETLTDHICRCAEIVTLGLKDSFYKITAKALGVAVILLPRMRPDITQPLPATTRDSIHALLSAVFAPLRSNDSDLEVRQRSLTCAGDVIALMGDEVADTVPELLSVLMQRLDNEITRVAAAGAIATVARSPLNIDLSAILHPALSAFSKDLKKNNRQLRVSALSTMDVLLTEHHANVSEDVVDQVLSEIPALLQEKSDLQLVGLAVQVTTTCCRCNPSSWTKLQTTFPILATTQEVLETGSLQGEALKSMCQLYACAASAGVPNMDQMSLSQTLLAHVVTPINAARADGLVMTRVSLSNIGRVVGAMALTDSSKISAIVTNFSADLTNDATSPSLMLVALACIGHIGCEYDFSGLGEIQGPIIHAFKSPNDDVRSAAAIALGNVACGNLQVYVPVIMQLLETNPDHRYLFLQSFKAIISDKTSNATTAQALQPHVEQLWGALLHSSESDQEGTRNVVSECLGRLAVVSPSALVTELQKIIVSPSVHARSTAVNAMRFLLNVSTSNEEAAIKPALQDFLRAIGDPENEVRRAAVLTFNTALQAKPHLVMEALDEIVQLIYQETDVRQDLVREVAMGPFKHRIDDGLDTRKAAFECLFTVVDVCAERLSVPVFLENVLKGLRDHYDIKLLMFLMLARVTTKFPSDIVQRMEDFALVLQETIDHKLKKNAVAQEVEKNEELKRTAVRAVYALAHVPGSEKSAQLLKLVETVKATPTLLERWNVLQSGVSSSDNAGGMDIRLDA
eukprot:m.175090 g.175090  ORF g.175090 m.175090 type:complete len:1246 (+) comp16767_c0_seq1:136-3873(+)